MTVKKKQEHLGQKVIDGASPGNIISHLSVDNLG